MHDDQKTINDLRIICRQQYEAIEAQKLHIWDVEEENRVLQAQHQELLDTIDARQQRIDDLEHWCGHLQGLLDAEVAEREAREQQYQMLEQKLGIFFKIARKIKRWLTRT